MKVNKDLTTFRLHVFAFVQIELFRMKNFVCSSLLIFVFVFLRRVQGEWKAIEKPCLCQQFRCNDGTCLDKERACNGVIDCLDGEDERNNLTESGKCTRKTMKCSGTEFKCKFGGCIKPIQVCDGTIDCWGSVDEATDLCTWLHTP